MADSARSYIVSTSPTQPTTSPSGAIHPTRGRPASLKNWMSLKAGIMGFVSICNKPQFATELYIDLYTRRGIRDEGGTMSTTTPWFIRARLKTRQLMLLTAICDEGNIHRAAEILNMSQPAASKLLKDLEDMLGVSLFERQPRGMRPNWYGETMIRHARIALSSLREAGQEIDALKAGLSGYVSLGAITGPALSLIPQAIMIVARENPKLRVELHVESSNVLIEQLAQGKIDIMIGRLFERQDKTGLRYERLAEEPVAAVGRPGHPLLNVAGLSLAAVEKKAWIVPPQ